MSTDAKDIIRDEYGDSVNFMTPEPLRYEVLGSTGDGHSVAVEVSQGTGLAGDALYGASFVLQGPDGETRRLHDLSGCRPSRAEIEALVDHVRTSVAGAESVSDFYWES